MMLNNAMKIILNVMVAALCLALFVALIEVICLMYTCIRDAIEDRKGRKK